MDDTYRHRSEDKNGNPDDLFTEKEALKLAKEQGIEFVDSYVVMREMNQISEKFDTQAKAEKYMKTLKGKGFSIAQIRERK